MERNFHIRTCIGVHGIGKLEISCGKEFKPTSPKQKRCPECSKAVSNERSRLIMAAKYKKKGFPNREFEGNPNWKGGTSLVRERAFKLYGEICKVCGSVENLVVTMLDGDAGNVIDENLVVLCRSCASSRGLLFPKHSGQQELF